MNTRAALATFGEMGLTPIKLRKAVKFFSGALFNASITCPVIFANMLINASACLSDLISSISSNSGQ
uniref:hypothetical protein n=1 Tax=Ruminiclostridium cellobioparum TaxID=29355 RepID=UPI0035E43505